MNKITITNERGWYIACSDDGYSGEGSDFERALRSLMETFDTCEKRAINQKLFDRLKEEYDNLFDEDD